jgi:hypothetical protein
VFLTVRDGALPVVFGLNQGVFRVRVDGRTLRRMVTPPALMARGDAAELVVRGAADRRALPLEAFGVQVQTVIADAAARSGR